MKKCKYIVATVISALSSENSILKKGLQKKSNMIVSLNRENWEDEREQSRVEKERAVREAEQRVAIKRGESKKRSRNHGLSR